MKIGKKNRGEKHRVLVHSIGFLAVTSASPPPASRVRRLVAQRAAAGGCLAQRGCFLGRLKPVETSPDLVWRSFSARVGTGRAVSDPPHRTPWWAPRRGGCADHASRRRQGQRGPPSPPLRWRAPPRDRRISCEAAVGVSLAAGVFDGRAASRSPNLPSLPRAFPQLNSPPWTLPSPGGAPPRASSGPTATQSADRTPHTRAA